jgi:hypothetical protein
VNKTPKHTSAKTQLRPKAGNVKLNGVPRLVKKGHVIYVVKSIVAGIVFPISTFGLLLLATATRAAHPICAVVHLPKTKEMEFTADHFTPCSDVAENGRISLSFKLCMNVSSVRHLE